MTEEINMENENMNLMEEEVTAEEITVEEPVVEEVEEVVADEASDVDEDVATEEEPEETASEKLARKFGEVKAACCGTIDRIAHDLKETNYNPYIKQTRTYKLEIFRNCNDEEPIDVYETTDVKSFSAKALAVAGTAAMLLMFATNGVVKKLLK